MLMATAVSRLAEKTPGKESAAIESFARALRQVNFQQERLTSNQGDMIHCFCLVTVNYC